MRPVQVVAAFASLSAVSSAWPSFDFDGSNALQGIERMLHKRQSNSASTNQATSASTATRTTSGTTTGRTTTTGKSTGTAKGTATDSSASASGTDAAASGTDASKSNDTAAATTAYDPRLPAGGIQMITPAVISGQQFYKIGDFITFAWNYTSLEATPTAIDILATCTANQATYTLATNQTVEATGRIIWDTKKYQESATVPLLTEKYQLIVYDAESSVSAAPKAGYLAVFDQFTFGMYTPQPYTPWSDFQCPTCSGAMSQQERQTWFFLFAMTTITILSFTWFGSGFGVF